MIESLLAEAAAFCGGELVNVNSELKIKALSLSMLSHHPITASYFAISFLVAVR